MFRPMTARQWTFDAVLAVLYFALAGYFGLQTAFYSSGRQVVLAVGLSAVLAGALAVRRYAPAVALTVAWFVAVAQMLAGLQPAMYDLAIFGVLYATAAYGSRLVFWLGFSSALVGALVATLYLQLGRLIEMIRLGDMGALVTAGFAWMAASFALLLAWTVGALVRAVLRSRASRIAQVQAESDAAAEQERVRIARDMHDVVAHSLAVVIAQADGARYAAAAGPDAAASARGMSEALGTISTTARAALADVRLLLGQLRHSQGDGPQPTLADLEGLYAQVRAAGLELRVTVDPTPRADPSAAVQLAVFRILQEALTNAIRHGDGAAVDVRLEWMADAVALTVRNPMPEDAVSASGGHGLIGMRERAQLAGGTLDAGVERAAFAVRARIPMRAADDAPGGQDELR
ncbi:MAG TPA: histidine kinase [Microbacterium sp.]|uniref:sensor histidine kinase n=1 Tax=Microbacterium sp. TaxID=51671 RepID=UPI002B4683A5|nr:histidine kinase [Microbacterium sp.]HKT55427.1 histidine kinase [Microbacterium sp.]